MFVQLSAQLIAVVADLVAITVLVYGIYFRRHHRRDLVLAYVGLNTGVLLVTMALLTSTGASLGLGLGLFGVLSIIRLRSDAISQEEVAYYFVALALGLVNGMHSGPAWLSPLLSASVVFVVYLADHPKFAVRTRRALITLDRAYPDEADLVAHLATLLRAQILHTTVAELDLVRDVTVVDVRYRLADRSASGPAKVAHRQSGEKYVLEPLGAR